MKTQFERPHIAGTAIILAAVLAAVLVLTGCPNDTSDSSDNYATGGNIVSTADDLISALNDPKNGDTVYFIGGNIDKPVSVPATKKVIITNVDHLPNAAGATSAVVSSGDGVTSLTAKMVVGGTLITEAGSLTVSTPDEEHIGSLDIVGDFVAKDGTSVVFDEGTRFYVYGSASFEGTDQLTLNTEDVFAVDNAVKGAPEVTEKSVANTKVKSVLTAYAANAALAESGVEIVVLTGISYSAGSTDIIGAAGKSLYVAGNDSSRIKSIDVPNVQILSETSVGIIKVSGTLTNNGVLDADTLNFGSLGELDNTNIITVNSTVSADAGNEVVNAGYIDLTNADITLPVGFKNDGVIASVATSNTTQAALIALGSTTGTGTVLLQGNTASASSEAIAMKQNVEIGSGTIFKVPAVATPFTGEAESTKTITLNNNSVLEFAEGVTSLGIAAVVDKSTSIYPAKAKTSATTGTAVQAFVNLPLGINTVEASGVLADTTDININVPAGKTLNVTGAWTNTGNVKFAGNVVVDGSGKIKVATDKTLTVDAGGKLTLKTDHTSSSNTIGGSVLANGNIDIVDGGKLTVHSGSTLKGTGTIAVNEISPYVDKYGLTQNENNGIAIVPGATGLTAASDNIEFNAGAAATNGLVLVLDLHAAIGTFTSLESIGVGAVHSSTSDKALTEKLLSAPLQYRGVVLSKLVGDSSDSGENFVVSPKVHLILYTGSTLANVESLTVSNGGWLTVVGDGITADRVTSASTGEPVNLLYSGSTIANLNALLNNSSSSVTSKVKYVYIGGSSLTVGSTDTLVKDDTKLELGTDFICQSSSMLLGKNAELIFNTNAKLIFSSSSIGLYPTSSSSIASKGPGLVNATATASTITATNTSGSDTAIIRSDSNGTYLAKAEGATLTVSGGNMTAETSSGLIIGTASQGTSSNGTISNGSH